MKRPCTVISICALLFCSVAHYSSDARDWLNCTNACEDVPFSAAKRQTIIARGYPYGNDYTGGPYIGTLEEPYARPYYYQSRWPFTFGYMAVETGKKQKRDRS